MKTKKILALVMSIIFMFSCCFTVAAANPVSGDILYVDTRTDAYRTGTVAWHFWVVLEYIFGLKMSASNGVELKPCLPKEWQNVKLTRRFGDKTYQLTVSDGKTDLKIVDSK